MIDAVSSDEVTSERQLGFTVARLTARRGRGRGRALRRRRLRALRPRGWSCSRARRRGSDSALRRIAIDGDEELERRYRIDLPVVLVDGETAFTQAVAAGPLAARRASAHKLAAASAGS